MAVYYRTIKGKKFDGKLIDRAESSVKGRGDGRISLEDARKILGTVKDGSEYTDVEKKTMRYIRDHFKFTAEADRWFRTQIRKWAASKGGSAKPAPKKAAKKPAPKAKKRAALLPAYEDRNDYVREERISPAREGKKGKSLKKILLILLILIATLLLIWFWPCVKKLFVRETAPVPHPANELKQEAGKPPVEVKIEEKIKAPEKPVAKEKIEEKIKAPEKAVVKEKIEGVEGVDYYKVKPKDSLISISEELTGDYNDWMKLYDANKDVIKSPIMIFPAHRLRIPDSMKAKLKKK